MKRGTLIHGYTTVNHPLYSTYNNIKARCGHFKHEGHKNYAGRGIRMCDRWLESFENFANDMGLKPTPEHSIERVDNDGNYEPDNCKWATRIEQNRNKRIYKTNVIGYSGISMTKAGTYRVRTVNDRILLGCFATLDEAVEAQKLNQKQSKPRVNNTTGVKGVTRQGDSFIVRRVINGKRVYLGNVKTLDDAVKLYNSCEKQERKVREV
jgi:hypothetical protein